MLFDDIIKAINICTDFKGLPRLDLNESTLLTDYFDSMGRLEILLALESFGYNINMIKVSDITTIKNLKELLTLKGKLK